MNILHHKSWHVRNKNNIERVRRDEEKAALEEKERQRKIALAEQEARTEFLRVKSRKRIEDAGNSSNQVDSGKSEERSQESAVSTFGAGALSEDIYSGKHINFFKETDGMVVSDRKNAEHEADKKKEQEEWEKKVGILTYLGQSSNETSASWYNQRKRKHEDEEEDGSYEKQKSREKNRKLQDHLDPIRQMDCYLAKKKHKDKDEKHKEHKKKKHRQDREKSSSKHKTSSSSKQKPKASIEQLRAERLKREMEERQRTAQLLAKHRGEKTEPKSQEVSEREQTYNSQFNPELARKPRRKPHMTYD